MQKLCKCGGIFISIDANEAVRVHGITHICYKTVRLFSGYASWKCNKCSALQKQKLRTKTPETSKIDIID